MVKDKHITSETDSFFSKNDCNRAINCIIGTISRLNLDFSGIGIEKRHNCKLTSLQVLDGLHRGILGFKGLFLCHTDGKTQTMLGFSLHGEEGKKECHLIGMIKMGKIRYRTEARNLNAPIPHQQAEEGEAGHTDKYMVEGRNHKHQNEPNQMSDTEYHGQPFLFHAGNSRRLNIIIINISTNI